MIGPHGLHADYVWAAYAISAFALAGMTLDTFARANHWRGRASEQERLRETQRGTGAPSAALKVSDSGEAGLVTKSDPAGR